MQQLKLKVNQLCYRYLITNLGPNIHELTTQLLVAIVELLVLAGKRDNSALEFFFGVRNGNLTRDDMFERVSDTLNEMCEKMQLPGRSSSQ